MKSMASRSIKTDAIVLKIAKTTIVVARKSTEFALPFADASPARTAKSNSRRKKSKSFTSPVQGRKTKSLSATKRA